MKNQENFYKGAQGNLSLLSVTISLAALAAGAEKTLFEGVPIGTQVVGVRTVHDGLGSNTQAKVDLVSASGVKTNLLTAATTSADATSTPLKPFYVGDDGPSDLVLTNSGSGVANGEITIQLEYRFKGY